MYYFCKCIYPGQHERYMLEKLYREQYMEIISLNFANIAQEERTTDVITSIYLLVGSAYRIAFSRYTESLFPFGLFCSPVASKLPRGITKLPAATSNLRETNVIIYSLTIFPGALSRKKGKGRRRCNVAVGLRKSRKSRIARGIRCGERGTRVVRHFSASVWVSETILLLKAAPTASREIRARREMVDHTATEERLIKRAKTVFIKFICGNMRRLK